MHVTGDVGEIDLTKAVGDERRRQGRQRTTEQPDLRGIGRARGHIDGLKLGHALMLLRSIDIVVLAGHRH